MKRLTTIAVIGWGLCLGVLTAGGLAQVAPAPDPVAAALEPELAGAQEDLRISELTLARIERELRELRWRAGDSLTIDF